MALGFEPSSGAHLESIRRFNQRLCQGGAPAGFLLPETAPLPEVPGAIRKRQFLLLEDEEVRGGCLLQEHEIWLRQQVRAGANLQMPVTEGLIDRRYAHLGLALMKKALELFPCLFAVGMGSATQPLPRLLSAMKFRVVKTRFLFRVQRAGRFCRQIRALRTTPARRRLADLAAATGLGALALGMLQAAQQARASRGRAKLEPLRTLPLEAWPVWANAIWERARARCSFAVVRDRAALNEFLAAQEIRLQAVGLLRAGEPAGWIVLLHSEMRNNQFFGDLRVATVLDALAEPGLEDSTAAASVALAAEREADLVIANHTHSAWIQAFRRCGFLEGPSNYLLATSPALTAEILACDPEGSRIHITRADGDGRIHL